MKQINLKSIGIFQKPEKGSGLSGIFGRDISFKSTHLMAYNTIQSSAIGYKADDTLLLQELIGMFREGLKIKEYSYYNEIYRIFKRYSEFNISNKSQIMLGISFQVDNQVYEYSIYFSRDGGVVKETYLPNYLEKIPLVIEPLKIPENIKILSAKEEEALVDIMPELLDETERPLRGLYMNRFIDNINELFDYLTSAVFYLNPNDFLNIDDYRNFKDLGESMDILLRLPAGTSLNAYRELIPNLFNQYYSIDEDGIVHNRESLLSIHSLLTEGFKFKRICNLIPGIIKFLYYGGLVVIPDISLSLHPVLETKLLDTMLESIKSNRCKEDVYIGQLIFGSKYNYASRLNDKIDDSIFD